MWYEINVSKDGTHYFATAARSIPTELRAREIADQLKHAFPENDGYKISITRWEKTGQTLW